MSDVSAASGPAANGARPSQDAQLFQIGITMSGAISAGAYTAGVFDFLIEALDAWETERASADAGPAGRAVIKTMAGASAGAITAGIGTIALAGTERAELGRYLLGRLYDAWVVAPTLVSPLPNADLLALDDLADPARPAASLLNANRLTEIGTAALAVTGPPRSRPYVSATLHVYMTLVDLRGTPYTIDFKGSGGYHMLSHAARAHFAVAGLGGWPTTSAFADDDRPVLLNAADLFVTPTPSRWTAFATAALGSAAFPIGLAPRRIESTYGPVKFPTGEGGAPKPVPTAFDPVEFPPGQPFGFVAVDGGVIDNDPFEYARFTLMGTPPDGNDRDADTADRAVLMIAPFPEAPPLLDEGMPPITVASIAGSVLTALRQQVRFKPDQLLAVRDESVFSRFMVSPTRVRPGQSRAEDYAIASGLLGGFGGFVTRPFRDHDYQLGRRNCQQFLRRNFALPASRSYFDGWTGPSREAAAIRPASGNLPADMLPIVPLFGTAAREVPYPEWPRLSRADFETLVGRIETRYLAVGKNLVTTGQMSVRMALLWRLGLSIGKARITTYLRYEILADLILRDQIAGFDLPDTLVDAISIPDALRRAMNLAPGAAGTRSLIRAVLAALAKPDYDYRTPGGIARSLKAKRVDTLQPAVLAVLDALAGLDAAAPVAAWKAAFTQGPDKAPVYTLALRKPSFLSDLLQGHAPGFAPTVD